MKEQNFEMNNSTGAKILDKSQFSAAEKRAKFIFNGMSLEEKRNLLHSARIRFGIECKIPREIVIDKIIERALFLSPMSTLNELFNVFKEYADLPSFRKPVLESSLRRLEKDNRIECKNERFQLTEAASKDVENELVIAEKRFNNIINRIFADIITKENENQLKKFFLSVFSEIFARLGNQWLKLRIGQITVEEFVEHKELVKIISKNIKEFSLDNLKNQLERRCLEFIRESDPEYDYFKFSLGQSFYIAKILGLDTQVDLLSKETFSESRFYLDTNVIVHALIPNAKHYKSFMELTKICKALNAELFITEITKKEFDRLVASQRNELGKIFDEVPSELKRKTRGIFFEAYNSAKQENPSLTVDEFFKQFDNIRDRFQHEFGIEVVDNQSFDSIIENNRTEFIKNALQSAWLKLRPMEKREKPLEHDAFHYLLIEKERSEISPKIWLLTLDLSLPVAVAYFPEILPIPFCFNLGSFLQSISPFIVTDDEFAEFSEIFSKIISSQLIPQEQIFDIRDFLVFHDIGMSCQEMPVEDIEDCLLYLKKEVLEGDSYSRDKFEKIAYEVKKFFSDPSRKYKTTIAEKDRQIEKMKKSLEINIQKLTDEQKRQKDLEVKRKKHKKFITEMALSLLVFSCLVGLSIFIAYKFGEGQNFFKKQLDLWHYHVIALFLVLLIAKVFILKDKFKDVIRALKEIKDIIS